MNHVKRCIVIGALLATTGASAWAETALQRGRYLVESIAGCGNCHTPQGPAGPVPGMALAGGVTFEDPGFTAISPNITPDRDTGIGRWTDAQIALAIREGRRPDGTLIGLLMPIGLYRGIADDDLSAMVAYLRSVPPVKSVAPKSRYIMPPPAWSPPVSTVAAVPPSDRLAYGRYLAGPLGHCIECHSAPGPQGGGDTEHALGAGGMVFKGPWGQSKAPNITPNGRLKDYTDGQIKQVITTGVRPDGSRLLPPMGTGYYAKMKASDLDALVAYLRNLPPK